jgi:biopolymer transport protein ExbB/TolQ
MMGLLTGGWLKAGLVVALLLAAFAWHQYDRHAAYIEGAQSERILWEEARRKAIAEAETAKMKAQAEINRIELDHLQQQAKTQIEMADLEKALDDEKNTPAPACGPVLSRRLRDAIQKAGH